MKWQARAVQYHQRLGGKPRPYKPYRCAECGGRRTLRCELWEYVRPPQCRCCGAHNWLMDMVRYREWKDRRGPFDTCNCDGAWWSVKGGGHRRGSVPLCIHSVTWEWIE